MAGRDTSVLDLCDGFVKGTCMTMCPERELLMRQRENLLHPLEIADGGAVNISASNKNSRDRKFNTGIKKQQYIADPEKTVKCFTRSAAGNKPSHPSELRPTPVLLKTISYLINEVAAVSMEEKYWVIRYQFVADRLRAVCQDLVIQNLPVLDSIHILEPIVRFHCYSAYRLCEEPLNDFDPKLNLTRLQECIKKLLVMYDSVDTSDKTQSKQSLINQNEFEVLYTVLNMGDVSAITRALERSCSGNAMEKLALQLSISWLCGNYARVFRLVSALPTLAICIVATQLPSLCKRALTIMNTAFSCKNVRVPLSYVMSLLKWSDRRRAIRECRYYGLSVVIEEEEAYISFLKGTFQSGTQQVFPVRNNPDALRLRVLRLERL